MTRPARVLCVLYGAVSLWLACCTVQQARYGAQWATFMFAAASVMPVVAIVREFDLADERRAVAGLGFERRESALRPPPPDVDPLMRTEIPLACCERWWTALGTDHDPTCPQQRRG
ncbi:hypothetical protein [Streptomyces sp. NPDC005125]